VSSAAVLVVDDDGPIRRMLERTLSAEGYRLIWFHSTSKAEHDADARYKQVARTTARLSNLQQKLSSPRTRY